MQRAKSNAIKNGLQRDFANGQSRVGNRTCYGYRKDEKGELAIDPAQAKVVRRIFTAYLEGGTSVSIAKMLSDSGVPSPSGKGAWSRKSIESMLVNEKYAGSVLLQKFITTDTGRVRNRGQAAKYLVSGHHDGIISQALFQAAQDKQWKRSAGKGRRNQPK